MPTTLVRSLKVFKPQQFNFLRHIGNVRPVLCRRLAVPQAEQQCTEPRRKEGFSLFSLSLSPPSNGNKATARFFSLDYKGILRMEHPFPLKMEVGKAKGFVEEKSKQSGEGAKIQEEEKARLQKEQEKIKEEERNRVKEQEIEDKIGPPPEKPLAGDCCGQGCEVCVWDTYWDELDNYNKLRKEAEEASG